MIATDNPYSYLRTSATARVILAAALVFVLTLLLPKGTTIDYDYQVGSIWTYEDVIASFAFPVYRDVVLYEAERQAAIANTIRSFDRVDTVARHVSISVKHLFAYLEAITEKEIELRRTPANTAEINRMNDSLHAAFIPDFAPLPLTSADWSRLILVQEERKQKKYEVPSFNSILQLMEQQIVFVLRNGYLDQLKSDFTKQTLALQEGKQERIRPTSQFLDRNDVFALMKKQFIESMNGNDSLAATVAKLTVFLLHPNIVFNKERTQIALDWNVDHVPRTIGIVKENERIVSKHDRVTPDIKAKLDSYRKAKVDQGGDVNIVLLTIGKVGHVILILFLMGIYLYQFRKKIFFDNSHLLAISILIVFEALLAYLTFNIRTSSPVEYLIVVPTAAMLLTIMYDSRVGFNGTIVISILIGAIRGNDYSIILASIAAGALSVYTVRDMKYRSQIFRSLAFIFLAYAFTIVILGLQRYEDIGAMTHELLYALGNSIISPVLTYGLLVFFERVFGITTDLTLLELSDFNHPLLRNLSTQAPGTFHHSIVMGTLAETAAKSIGANPTLARVGAYYHDIGKIVEPEFFVENQISGTNIHEDLDPIESSKHIINHVQQGIDLARQHNIPERIIDFIPAHHGKTIVAYFFDKERKAHPDAETDDFRYPGPKPQTKETGIVMLADTIEAAARSIEDPTVEKLEKLLDDIVGKRLEDGELDECDLTMRDLREIKNSFLGILTGIHHSRIQYPNQEAEESARKNAERTTKLLNLPSTVDALTRRIKKIDSK